MKYLQNLLSLILGCVVFLSCSQEETLQQESLKVNHLSIDSVKTNFTNYKLISKRVLGSDEINVLKSKAITYQSAYDCSIPVYRYSYYDESTNYIDIFCATEKYPTWVHEGRTYKLGRNHFNVMPTDDWRSAIPIYRLYSPISKGHMLSTSQSVGSYTYESLLGYVFSEQQVGSVPVKEYYSSLRDSYLYVVNQSEEEDSLPVNDPDFHYVKTIGYAYFGQSIDEKKKATRFIIKKDDDKFPSDVELKVKVRERDNYLELIFKTHLEKKGDSVIIPIHNTYTVVAADFSIIYGNKVSIFENVTDPNFKNGEMSGLQGAILMVLDRYINGFDVTYSYSHTIVLGNE